MDFIVYVFLAIWFVGFASGFAAVIGFSGLHKHGENVPFLLKASAISMFFPRYYKANESRRKTVATLMLICIFSIVLGSIWLLVTLPELREVIWNGIFETDI